MVSILIEWTNFIPKCAQKMKDFNTFLTFNILCNKCPGYLVCHCFFLPFLYLNSNFTVYINEFLNFFYFVHWKSHILGIKTTLLTWGKCHVAFNIQKRMNEKFSQWNLCEDLEHKTVKKKVKGAALYCTKPSPVSSFHLKTNSLLTKCISAPKEQKAPLKQHLIQTTTQISNKDSHLNWLLRVSLFFLLLGPTDESVCGCFFRVNAPYCHPFSFPFIIFLPCGSSCIILGW